MLRSSRAEQRMHNPDDDLDLNALLNDDAGISALARVTSTSSAASSKTDEDAYVSANEGASDASVDDDHDDGAIAPEGIAETLAIRLVRPPHALLNVPITQETPLMTEDMSAEREARLRAFGDDARGRAERQRAQSDSLVSDMSAFKAANPSAAFEDFVRWHSPKDWIDGDDAPVGGDDGRRMDECPPRVAPRGALSERMRRDGNAWRTLWDSAPRVSARAQKMALFDPIVEGEKALHHLETTAAAALVDVVARCAVTSALALVAAARAVRSHPDDTKDAIHRASTAISRIFAQTEDRALSLAELDVVVGELQLAERAVFRAESLLARLPLAPPSLIHDLLRRARAWESVRETDISRASRLVVSARVVDASPRASLLARVADLSTPSSIEYAVRASPRARTIADHGLRVSTRDDLVRASVRISAPSRV